MYPSIQQKVTKDPDLEEVRKQTEEAIKAREEAEKQAKAAQEEKLRTAALVLETLETDGGKEIKKQIEEMRELWNMAPEQMFRTISGDATGQNVSQEVDRDLVARLAGAREALNSVLSWFEECEYEVAEAATNKKDETEEESSEEN